MDLRRHGWHRESEAREDEYDDEKEEEDEEVVVVGVGEEEECSEWQGKDCIVANRFPGEGTWPPGGCSHRAASCWNHNNKGMR